MPLTEVITQLCMHQDEMKQMILKGFRLDYVKTLHLGVLVINGDLGDLWLLPGESKHKTYN